MCGVWSIWYRCRFRRLFGGVRNSTRTRVLLLRVFYPSPRPYFRVQIPAGPATAGLPALVKHRSFEYFQDPSLECGGGLGIVATIASGACRAIRRPARGCHMGRHILYALVLSAAIAGTAAAAEAAAYDISSDFSTAPSSNGVGS